MLFRFLLIPLFAFSLFGCGPERTSEQQKDKEYNENQKLDRQRLLDRANAWRPQIPYWVGCYEGRYSNQGGVTVVIVSLKERVQLVTPGDGGIDVEPVELPTVVGFVYPKDRRSEVYVALTEFKANADATYIELIKPGGASGAYSAKLSLNLDASGNHAGYYEAGSISVTEMSLAPINERECQR